MSKIIFFLILIFSINSNEEPKTISLNKTNTDKEKPFNLTIDEIDTMMVCSMIMEEKMKKYSNNINNVKKRFNFTKIDFVNNKVSMDIFEKCNKEIKIEKVNYHIKNLTFINDFVWEKIFDKISEINFDKYKNISDMEMTAEQNTLKYKFKKSEEVFQQKQMEDRERYIKANQKIKIGSIDLENIPQNFKLGIFLIIFFIFFGSIFYYLKGLNKKLGSNPKKKKKKTQ